MHKSYWGLMIMLVLSGAIALSGCSQRGTNSETGTGMTSESKNRMSDSDLKDKIKNRLDSDAQIQSANLSVSADADKNEVTLSGTVNSEEQRTRAVTLARSAAPGAVVTDKIDVKPAELSRTEYGDDKAAEERSKARDRGDTIGSSSNDAWIHMKMVAQLMTDADTPMRKINVDVDNGVVTLRGTVENAHQKAEAERIAKGTEGVKRVVNALRVGKSSETLNEKHAR